MPGFHLGTRRKQPCLTMVDREGVWRKYSTSFYFLLHSKFTVSLLVSCSKLWTQWKLQCLSGLLIALCDCLVFKFHYHNMLLQITCMKNAEVLGFWLFNCNNCLSVHEKSCVFFFLTKIPSLINDRILVFTAKVCDLWVRRLALG